MAKISQGLRLHIQCHPEKGNIAADALSCRPYPTTQSSALYANRVVFEEFKKLEINAVVGKGEIITFYNESTTHIHRGDPSCLRNRPITSENDNAGARRQSIRICDP